MASWGGHVTDSPPAWWSLQARGWGYGSLLLQARSLPCGSPGPYSSELPGRHAGPWLSVIWVPGHRGIDCPLCMQRPCSRD